jgi:hypothetical protein
LAVTLAVCVQAVSRDESEGVVTMGKKKPARPGLDFKSLQRSMGGQ